MQLKAGDLEKHCFLALRQAGAGEQAARSLAAAIVGAELRGHADVGVKHLFDFLEAYSRGAIDASAEPTISGFGSIIQIDAHHGIAHDGFSRALNTLLTATKKSGIAALSVRNTFPVGELSHYTHRLAEAGLLAIASSNSPAMVSYRGSSEPVLGTNPFSFAAPASPFPLLVDQAITPTAFVTVREMARRGEQLPPGWAVDADGIPTIDPVRALSGALLPDGEKMGNIGLMVDILAGINGSHWSTEAPSFDGGGDNPGVGMLILTVDPAAFGADVLPRLQQHIEDLEDNHGISLPGRRRTTGDSITLDDATYSALLQAAGHT